MTSIAIAGSSGRMGRSLIEAVLSHTELKLGAALDVPDSKNIGLDAGQALGVQTGVQISHDVMAAMEKCDVLIDFTRPEGTLVHLDICTRLGKKMVIGTTGFDAQGKAAIAQAAEKTALVFASNMSVGVNVTLKLIELATQYLHADYDIEVFEAHHKHKIDAPSGTALTMGQTIAQAMGADLDQLAQWARHGHTGERKAGSIGFSVMRGGDIVGDHTVYFAGLGERIEITHRSTSRSNYAAGSLKAAQFLSRHQTGLFDMQAVLGLSASVK